MHNVIHNSQRTELRQDRREKTQNSEDGGMRSVASASAVPAPAPFASSRLSGQTSSSGGARASATPPVNSDPESAHPTPDVEIAVPPEKIVLSSNRPAQIPGIETHPSVSELRNEGREGTQKTQSITDSPCAIYCGQSQHPDQAALNDSSRGVAAVLRTAAAGESDSVQNVSRKRCYSSMSKCAANRAGAATYFLDQFERGESLGSRSAAREMFKHHSMGEKSTNSRDGTVEDLPAEAERLSAVSALQNQKAPQAVIISIAPETGSNHRDKLVRLYEQATPKAAVKEYIRRWSIWVKSGIQLNRDVEKRFRDGMEDEGVVAMKDIISYARPLFACS